MSDLAAILTASGGVLTVVGGGIAWLWSRVEKRFEEVEKKLEACESREVKHNAIIGKHLIVIELLWQEVHRRSRGASPVLERSKKILEDLKEPANEH